MIKLLTAAWLFLLLLLLPSLYYQPITIFAQTDEEIAKKYEISFPIKDLGNCQNINECKAYCNEAKNQDACLNFAKKHGFYKQSLPASAGKKHENRASDEEILNNAKQELGCNSMDECMAFCEKEENMETCMDFASRHNLNAGGDIAQMKQVISNLKSSFNCSSMNSCMEVCNSGDNMKRCMEIFKAAGFPVHLDYSGPGGCNSEESCQTFCEKNPKECGGGSFESKPPEVWCSEVSKECKWDGETCICSGPESCAKSPGCSWNGQYCSCQGEEFSNNPPVQSGESWCTNAGSGCKWVDNTCQCGSLQGYTQEPPEVWCPKVGANCQWNDNQCSCVEPGVDVPKDNYSSYSDQKIDFSNECLKQSGCSWDSISNTCACPTREESQFSQKELEKQSCETDNICSWNGETCICPDQQSVQGISTQQGLLDMLINFLNNTRQFFPLASFQHF